MLRAEHPTLEKLILDVISPDYHETLFAAAGHQIEAARESAMKATPASTCWSSRALSRPRIMASTAKSVARRRSSWRKECAKDAAGVIAIGSCARGAACLDRSGTRPVPSAPTRSSPDKPVVTIPGCPPNPYNFLDGGALPDLRRPARDRRAGPSEVRLFAPDPRKLRTSRPLRCRPLRDGIR